MSQRNWTIYKGGSTNQDFSDSQRYWRVSDDGPADKESWNSMQSSGNIPSEPSDYPTSNSQQMSLNPTAYSFTPVDHQQQAQHQTDQAFAYNSSLNQSPINHPGLFSSGEIQGNRVTSFPPYQGNVNSNYGPHHPLTTGHLGQPIYGPEIVATSNRWLSWDGSVGSDDQRPQRYYDQRYGNSLHFQPIPSIHVNGENPAYSGRAWPQMPLAWNGSNHTEHHIQSPVPLSHAFNNGYANGGRQQPPSFLSTARSVGQNSSTPNTLSQQTSQNLGPRPSNGPGASHQNQHRPTPISPPLSKNDESEFRAPRGNGNARNSSHVPQLARKKHRMSTGGKLPPNKKAGVRFRQHWTTPNKKQRKSVNSGSDSSEYVPPNVKSTPRKSTGGQLPKSRRPVLAKELGLDGNGTGSDSEDRSPKPAVLSFRSRTVERQTSRSNKLSSSSRLSNDTTTLRRSSRLQKPGRFNGRNSSTTTYISKNERLYRGNVKVVITNPKRASTEDLFIDNHNLDLQPSHSLSQNGTSTSPYVIVSTEEEEDSQGSSADSYASLSIGNVDSTSRQSTSRLNVDLQQNLAFDVQTVAEVEEKHNGLQDTPAPFIKSEPALYQGKTPEVSGFETARMIVDLIDRMTSEDDDMHGVDKDAPMKTKPAFHHKHVSADSQATTVATIIELNDVVPSEKDSPAPNPDVASSTLMLETARSSDDQETIPILSTQPVATNLDTGTNGSPKGLKHQKDDEAIASISNSIVRKIFSKISPPF